MKTENFVELSKIVSHALRHEPQLYNLKLDNEGWVMLSDLVTSLNNKGLNVTNEIVIKMVKQSEKKRHQILNNKIRAFYGHSTAEKILKQQSIPPTILYHGTVINNLDSILEKGLLSMNRQYVHLSMDEETAKIVASRKNGEIAIIKIKAQEASKNNIEFFKEENGIWLSSPIPPKYIYL